MNDPPIGQTRSIDRVYARVGTEWIFHCEDDCEFFGDGFIGRSFAILEEFNRISMVSLKDPAIFEPGYFYPEQVLSSGIRYRVANPAVAKKFTGLFFSPGLRRMSDYRIIGPYAPLCIGRGEDEIGHVYRELGYRVAILADPAARHIGDGRHAPNRAKPRGFHNKAARSIARQAKRLKWRLWPNSHPVRRARRRQMATRLTKSR